MEELPDLSNLSHPEKDSVIKMLWEMVVELKATNFKLETQNRMLEKRVKKLEDQIAKNSGNSSKPPSSDTKPPRTKSQRKSTGKKSGGQSGHKGHGLKMSSTPDHIEIHKVSSCDHCHHPLGLEMAHDFDRRQVFDIPLLALEVTEHLVEIKECTQCGEDSRGQFPSKVLAPVQYGDRVKVLSVYLNQYQLMPLQRLTEYFEDVFGQRISEATILKFKNQLSNSLEKFECQVKDKLIKSSVVHFDETGHRVKGKRQWLHSSGTNSLTHYASHKKRGAEAMEAIGILSEYKGRAIHDFWSSYYKFDCDHGLCNSHHFRDLTFLEERYDQTWSKSMKRLLGDMHKAVEVSRERGHSKLSSKAIKKFEFRYKNLVTRGFNKQPEIKPTGRRGRPKKGDVLNFLERLHDRKDEVLAFMHDFNVPFTNNLAERDIRMVKVQQKISGTFRTQEGADVFCRIRSYISTCRKNSVKILKAMTDALQGRAFLTC